MQNPPNPPRYRPKGIWEDLRESLSRRFTGLSKQTWYLGFVALLVILSGLGFGVYYFGHQMKQAQAESLNSQGAILLDQGYSATAIGLFQQAIQASPEYAAAHHNMGMAYYVQGDLEQAMHQFQEAIALDPTYASPHYAMGRIFDDQGRSEEALSELWRAIELDPDMSEAYNELGYVLNRLGRYAEAVTALQEGLERGSESSSPYLLKNLGWAYLGLADPAQAVNNLEAAAAGLESSDALYTETHRLLAEAYEMIGDLDKALQEWQGPLQNEPDALENIQRLSSPSNEIS
jgi:tetratricopeptide (TPR) repeat protein